MSEITESLRPNCTTFQKRIGYKITICSMFNSPSGDKFNSFWRGREGKFLHMSQNVFMLHHCTHCLLCLVNNLHTLLLEKRIIKIHDLFFLLIFSFIKNLIHIFLGVGFVGFVKNYIFQTFLDSFFLSIASNLYI